MEGNPVIVAEGLTRRFGELVAVDHLALEVGRGEVFGFLGHNGAGKTTTVRLLNGVLDADAGTARVLGFDPVGEGPALRRHTGVLTETPSLDERLTALDNLRIYADLYGVPEPEVQSRVQTLLESFELADRAEEKVASFSKGMKQRLALARALVHEPELLFLDEPTAGLDPVAAHHVHELILRLSQERHTVCLCTHNLAEAQQLCDRVAVLEHGRVLAVGTPAELIQQYARRLSLEIEIEPSGAAIAAELLRNRFGAVDLQQAEGTLSLTWGSREQIPDLVAALAGAGVRIYRVAPQEATLEDVYFALHGEEVHP